MELFCFHMYWLYILGQNTLGEINLNIKKCIVRLEQKKTYIDVIVCSDATLSDWKTFCETEDCE